jgi:hypothetical protein
VKNIDDKFFAVVEAKEEKKEIIAKPEDVRLLHDCTILFARDALHPSSRCWIVEQEMMIDLPLS